MAKNNWMVGLVVGIGSVGLIVLVGLGFWTGQLGDGGKTAAQGTLAVTPLVLNTPVVRGGGQATSVPSAPTKAPSGENTPSAENTPSTSNGGAPTAVPASGGVAVFQIDQTVSQASFSLYEELRGSPKTVIGATNLVAGQIAINPADLSTTQIGVIQVSARGLTTDDDRRNRMIRTRILESDTYEFITFTPTAVRGLSGSAKPGDSFTFEIEGQLTIRNITQPAVFTVTVTADSEARVSGTATTTVQRTPFNLIIPNVPMVANVGEEVTLTLTFVATPVAGA